MRQRIICCFFMVAVAVAFHGIVTAQSLNYSDVVTVPQVDSKMPQIGDSSLNQAKAKPNGDGAHNPKNTILQRIKQDALSDKDEWSGSLDDLNALVEQAKQKYGFENTKHQGRNATMLVPANQYEMNRILKNGDNSVGSWLEGDISNKKSWPALGTGYHAQSAERNDGWLQAIWNTIKGSGVNKYIIRDGAFRGAEVVYDKDTGEIVRNWRMGTRNFAYVTDPEGDHDELDVYTHQSNSHYKYVGILFETDPSDPNKYYIVNGQTGKRMTWREAEDFPTTLSDEWKDMGLACVPDDANDVIKPDECRDDATCPNGLARKICICAEPETFFAGVVMVRIINSKKPSAQYYCRKCGGFRRGNMFDVIRTGSGIATYPGGVLPPDWDGKIYEKTELDEHVKNLLLDFDSSTKTTEGR